MPSPTPVKITPPASPRRAGGTCFNTAGAASAISAPPDIPAANRHVKYQANDKGAAQPKKAAVAAIIMSRSAAAVPIRAAIGRASSAPPRYPAKFAAAR